MTFVKEQSGVDSGIIDISFWFGDFGLESRGMGRSRGRVSGFVVQFGDEDGRWWTKE